MKWEIHECPDYTSNRDFSLPLMHQTLQTSYTIAMALLSTPSLPCFRNNPDYVLGFTLYPGKKINSSLRELIINFIQLWSPSLY